MSYSCLCNPEISYVNARMLQVRIPQVQKKLSTIIRTNTLTPYITHSHLSYTLVKLGSGCVSVASPLLKKKKKKTASHTHPTRLFPRRFVVLCLPHAVLLLLNINHCNPHHLCVCVCVCVCRIRWWLHARKRRGGTRYIYLYSALGETSRRCRM